MSGAASVLSFQQGEVVTLTLNRPDRLNALDSEMAEALRDAIAAVHSNATARVLVLRGEGTSFCSGGDVLAMQHHRDDLLSFIEKTIDPFHSCVMALQRLPMPVIACTHGALAGGGFSLALACDFVMAARSSRFVVAYPKLGAPADGGLSFFMVRCLGSARGLEALTTGGQFSAEEALQMGLVNRVADDDKLQEVTNRWIAELLALAPQSLLELKCLVAAQSADALQEHLGREKAAFMRCAAMPDFSARVSSFVRKVQRPPAKAVETPNLNHQQALKNTS